MLTISWGKFKKCNTHRSTEVLASYCLWKYESELPSQPSPERQKESNKYLLSLRNHLYFCILPQWQKFLTHLHHTRQFGLFVPVLDSIITSFPAPAILQQRSGQQMPEIEDSDRKWIISIKILFSGGGGRVAAHRAWIQRVLSTLKSQ
jgi:hypothetical protein